MADPKVRPILFSAPMILALLAGTKTQTRRVITRGADEAMLRDGITPSPYGQPGDRLIVREAWQYSDWTEDGHPYIGYRADGTRRLIERGIPDVWSEHLASIWAALSDPKNYGIDQRAADRRWRASIHMPRWASRLTLEITDVRFERLHEITESDATAEGCQARPFPGPWWQGYREQDDGELSHHQAIGEEPPEWMIEPKRMKQPSDCDVSARDAFRTLWCDINGVDSWQANPLVWVLSFRTIEGERGG